MPKLNVVVKENQGKCIRATVVRSEADVTERELREFGSRARRLNSKVFGTVHVSADSVDGQQLAVITPDNPGSYNDFIQLLRKIIQTPFGIVRI